MFKLRYLFLLLQFDFKHNNSLEIYTFDCTIYYCLKFKEADYQFEKKVFSSKTSFN